MKLIITRTVCSSDVYIFGFEILPIKEYNKKLKTINKFFKENEEIEVYYSPNNSILFNEDFNKFFEVKDISEAEIETLKIILNIEHESEEGLGMFDYLYEAIIDYDL